MTDRYVIAASMLSFTLYIALYKHRSKPGIERVQALADISRSAHVLSLQRNPCTDCKSAQQCTTRGRVPPTIPPSYIRVSAVVWECGEEHTRPWPLYSSRRLRLTRSKPGVDIVETSKLPLLSTLATALFAVCSAPRRPQIQQLRLLSFNSACVATDDAGCRRPAGVIAAAAPRPSFYAAWTAATLG